MRTHAERIAVSAESRTCSMCSVFLLNKALHLRKFMYTLGILCHCYGL